LKYSQVRDRARPQDKPVPGLLSFLSPNLLAFRHRLPVVTTALVIAMPSAALIQPYRRHFRAEKIKTDGATIYVRAGGRGPAVVMLHGFGDTGDMWAPLATEMVAGHTIVIPDLRGMGL
jgi:alpha-beta hydrolase superfamily lysophospholipase